MERQCLDQHVAGRVGQVYHVEIALQYAILARGAVDGDVSIVKTDFLAILHEREIVFIDDRLLTVGQIYVPILFPDQNDIDILTLMVHRRFNTLCRAQGNLIFRGVATTHDGYGSLGCIHFITHIKFRVQN